MTLLRRPKPLPELTTAQTLLLGIYARHVVAKSHWIFRGGTLRVEAASGKSVSIRCDEFQDLVDAELIEVIGSAGARLTAAGLARAPLRV